ncbi:signal recognition particle-docking protein FtsY [Spirochaeta isovalerica]|uniref:Signal recognition particle receptor FtsY n=1 Tax=Spirochaeta isovalerica TaxID=150 RepID=A0A841R8X8_9SPIO|nr:signal recognition particle-docking protein FtsY [Spirochaeta isovalerica]MBB6478932.1 fused signal recognition particle receptor [Spirochaeta isovalerica]
MFKFGKKEKTDKGVRKNLGRRLLELLNNHTIDESLFEDLEDLLIESDMGGTVTMEIVDQLRNHVKAKKISTQNEIIEELKSILAEQIKSIELIPEKDKLNVYLILGVNGVGKTTSIAKMARYYGEKGNRDIVLSAGDTFRAAAVEQLKIHGERTGFRVVHQGQGADPSAVIFDTIASAKARKETLVLADTAGRMHNRTNLVKELQKIDSVIRKKIEPGDNYRKILVIDSTTGQNGLQQAEVFNEAVELDAIILTKYDSTARGGNIISISRKLGIPFAFIGKGEKLTDLELFQPESYLEDLFSY